MDVRASRLRRLAYAGARYGPTFWVRHSPAFFGLAFACLLPRERRAVRENLRRIRGRRDGAHEALDVARTFVEYAHCLAESLGMDRPEALRAVPEVRGAEHLDTALALGRGAVIVTAHAGAWDAAALWLERDRRAEVTIVMAKEADTRARELQDAVRLRGGIRIVHTGGDAFAALPLLGQLKRGGLVAVQLDRTAGTHFLEGDLFRRPFPVPEGPFRLASLARAPVIPVFARRNGYFQYSIDVCPPIWVSRRASRDDLRAGAALALADLERFLEKNPTQWFHFG
jgi:KDO2-lipid IV(A) lauroyltransferase